MKEWVLKRNDDFYWYWEHIDGNSESPIFCVKKLALEWMKRYRQRIKNDPTSLYS